MNTTVEQLLNSGVITFSEASTPVHHIYFPADNWVLKYEDCPVDGISVWPDRLRIMLTDAEGDEIDVFTNINNPLQYSLNLDLFKRAVVLPELVVVPFDDNEYAGRTTGDSCWNPGIFFPYTPGMTVEDLGRLTDEYFLKEYAPEPPLCDTPESVDPDDEPFTIEDIRDEYGIDIPTGGWVIERKLLDAINNIDVDAGNDTALYNMVYVLKSAVANLATFTLE